MKLFSNKKYNVILKYAVIAIIITLLLVTALFRWDTIKGIFSAIVKIFEPIIWGAVIAFIMNPIMMSTEKFLNRFIFRKKPHPKISHAIGVAVAALVFIAVILAIILTVIPEIMSSIPGIYSGITNELIPKVQTWAKTILDDNPSVQEAVMNGLSDLGLSLQRLLSTLGPQLTGLLNSLLDFANSVKNFAFGFIVAIYFLASKKTLQAQAKKLIVACFREDTYRWIFNFTTNTNNALLNFIYGKVIDSVIIGILCGIGMLIFNMPYAMMISIIIGITNIIPIFGPFIGAIPSALLVLIAEPRKVIWFLLFILALQQLDGNIIGPKILGSKVGLSSFWMLFSIIVFGSMFGIIGMIVGVPLFAVAYDLIIGFVNSRLAHKNMPTDDDYYDIPCVEIGLVRDDDLPAEPMAIEQREDAPEDRT